MGGETTTGSAGFAANDEAIQAFLDEVFDETPVEAIPAYFASAAYQLRRELTKAHGHAEVAEGDVPIPPWMGRSPNLGPYERRIIRWLTSVRGLALLTGATGSGKTSLLKHIAVILRDASAAAGLLERTPASTVLYRVDLQPVSVDMTRLRADEGDKVEKVERLLGDVSDHLHASFKHLVTSEEDQARLFAEALWRVDRTVETSETGVVMEQLREACGERDAWIKEDIASRGARRRGAVEALGTGERRVIGALLPFGALARRHRELDLPLALGLDNVDQYPPIVQADLYETVRLIMASAFWRASGLAVVVALRPSSLVDESGTLPASARVAHKTPDPADVIFLKATRFLMFPETCPAWHRLTSGEQARSSWRIVQFWLRLLEERRGFSNLLSGLAGTNLRNAALFAKGWCLSEQLPPYEMSVEQREAFAAELPKVIAEYMIQEIGASVARGALEKGVRNELDARAVVEVVTDVLRSLAIVDGAFAEKHDSVAGDGAEDGDHIGLRLVLGATARRELLRRARDPQRRRIVKGQLPYTRMARYLVSLPQERFAQGHDVLNALEAALQGGLDSTFGLGGDARDEVTEWVCLWVVDTARAIFSGEISRAEVERGYVGIRSEAKHRLRRIVPNFSEPSSFESARVLFDSSPRMRHEIEHVRAVDLFSMNDRSCLVKLRLLYLVFEGHVRTQTIGGIVEDLEAHGFSKSEILGAVEEMLRADKRLIYSSVNDAGLAPAEFVARQTRRVKLSWSGRCYVTVLCASHAYLQWALLGNQEMARRLVADGQTIDLGNVRGRLEATLAALEVLQREEDDLSARLWERGKKPEHYSLTCGRATADVYFRSLGAFMGVLRSHAHDLVGEGGRGRQADKLRHIETIMERWMERGRVLHAQHEDIVAPPVLVRWEEEMGFAAAPVEDVRRLREK